MADFNDLWAEAVAVYEKQTERKIDKDNTFRAFGIDPACSSLS